MNQDSFRQLLTTPRPGSSSSLTPTLVVSQSTKKGTLDSYQPAFKPRKARKKKSDLDYRDRAYERRAGVNEYAQVESVLEDFVQRTASIEDRQAVEEQRRYLGGDKDHTILVKGLDFALLEQNKARATASGEDDDSLEAAFQEAQTQPTVPKKRTREDLIRELKEKRASALPEPPNEQSTTDNTLEQAKRIGKFKPIGAPHSLNEQVKDRNAKRKEPGKGGEGEKKKKRRKVAQNSANASENPNGERSQPQVPKTAPPEPSNIAKFPPQEALPNMSDAPNDLGIRVTEGIGSEDIVDIFADVGEYEGVDFEDGEGEQLDNASSATAKDLTTSTDDSKHDALAAMESWFKDSESTFIPGLAAVESLATSPQKLIPAEPEEPESKHVIRLTPLASSTLPSISDFLAMDAQAEAQKKRKLKKEKKVGAEKKIDTDYKKLNSYMAKKGGESV